MNLDHKLNRVRNILLAAARQQTRSCGHRETFAMLADAVEEAIDKLTQQEIEMSAAAEAIRYERSEKEKSQAQVTDLTAKLTAALAEPKLDADDQSEIAKTQAEQAAPVVTPAGEQVAPA